MNGFKVDLTSLLKAAEGVNGAITDMEYSKVSSIGGSGTDYGNSGLANVMSDFCGRWEIGVEHLTKDASEVAGRLTQSAEAYAEAENKNVSMVHGIMQRASGSDPAASSW